MNDALQDAIKAVTALRDQYKETVILEYGIHANSFGSPLPKINIRIHVIDKACVDVSPSLEDAVARIHEKMTPKSRLKEAEELEAKAKAIRAEVEAAAEAQTVAA